MTSLSATERDDWTNGSPLNNPPAKAGGLFFNIVLLSNKNVEIENIFFFHKKWVTLHSNFYIKKNHEKSILIISICS